MKRRKKRKNFPVLLLFLIAACTVILFPGDIRITKVGEWGTGRYRDVYVKGNYAYCAASRAGIDIIDIATPAYPRKVGNIDVHGYVNHLYISGNYAYVVVRYGLNSYDRDPNSGLQIIDITHPNFPILKGAFDIPYIKALYVKDDYAYVTADDHLKILDVSNPSSPTLLSDLVLTPDEGTPCFNFWGVDIHVAGNYAFIAVNKTEGCSDDDDYVTLEIVNVSNPRAPRWVGRYEPPFYIQYPLAVYARGRYVYLQTIYRLDVLDISKPAAPEVIGWCGCNSGHCYYGDIKIRGNYAYLAGNGLLVADISDPEFPIMVGKFECPSYQGAWGVHVDGNSAYVAYDTAGLQVVDVSNPNSPAKVGHYDFSHEAVTGLDSRDNYIYLLTSYEGLKVIDVSDPSSPKLHGNNDIVKEATNVHVSGSNAYVRTRYEGLQIFDISNPSLPVRRGAYSCNACDVDIIGNYAYVAVKKRFYNNLSVIDVSDPSNPTLVGNHNYDCSNVYIRGNYAYLGGSKLWVLDVSNPVSPVKIGEYKNGSVSHLHVNGNYAYAAGRYSGLKIFDISNPASPVKIGNYDIGGYVNCIFVSDGYAYVAFFPNKLLVIDVSDPSSPTLAESCDTPGEIKSIRVNNDCVYVADGDSGKLLILGISYIPRIGLNRSRLNFVSLSNEPGTGITPQSFLITNNGRGTLNWSLSVNRDWLVCSPGQGSGDVDVSVSVDTTGLSPGNYNGTITITDANASNSPQTVAVSLNIYEPGQTTSPFGVFATPIDGVMVSGSIPVTGWALDDVGVQGVQIFREEGKSLVYIGDAVFVEGARPDVEQAYPRYPQNYKAGWGYMMLTHFLPGGGNGIFNIEAVVTDMEGNQVTLGKKTITCVNARAFKPFGDIDTPVQGGTASGTDFINRGWALTPQPNTVPTNGSTITVWVDGVPLGSPVYNQYREDISSLFPGYNNSNGAGGYFHLDTAGYTDGLHTISWSVTDDAGNTDGIGSRYFTICNTSPGAPPTVHSVSLPTAALSEIPGDYPEPLPVKKGYNPGAEPENRYPDEDGRITIEIQVLERIEIQLPGQGHYLGYLVVGNRIKPLPPGSTLDAARGVFCWQPGPGFLGHYQFVFIKKEQNGEFKKKYINIVITPKFQVKRGMK
jgi:hypothetical protein